MTAPPMKSPFAVKGVFRVATRFGGSRRGRQLVFEHRIVLVTARSEREARKAAHDRFASGEWNAAWPAPDVARQSNSYVGIARILQLGGEMDPGEVWCEFTDSCPAIDERAPRKVPRRVVTQGRKR
jgi:hypothetical protein